MMKTNAGDLDYDRWNSLMKNAFKANHYYNGPLYL